MSCRLSSSEISKLVNAEESESEDECDNVDSELQQYLEELDEDNVEIEEEYDDVIQGDSEAESSFQTSDHVYKSKSGMLFSSGPARQSKRRRHNILHISPGPTQFSNSFNDIAEAFLLFMPPEILNIICHETNREAQRVTSLWNHDNPSKMKVWKDMTQAELCATIGILVASGKVHGQRISIPDLWGGPPALRLPFFTAAMSRNRFQSILQFIRFDDKSNRQQRIETTKDKLQAIREVFDKFEASLRKPFYPHEYLTVDERLAVYRGNCPFRVYMKSKPGRYGIKIWVCADVKTSYILGLQIYTGMIDNIREKNQGQRVVMDLIKPFF